MTCPIRGCWTTVRHSADVSGGRLVEDLDRDGDLADVVEQGRDPDPVDLGVGELELVAHLDDDGRDERRWLAAIVGERGDDRGQHVGGGVSSAASDLHGPGAPGVGDRGSGDAGVLVGLLEDVGLVPSQRLGRVHRGVGVADERLHPKLLAGSADDPDRDRHRQVRVALDAEPRPLDELAQLLAELGAFLDRRLGQDQHEFLTAVAADQVARAQAFGDRLGDAPQDDVAGRVAVRVVDRLEVVDVDECDAQGPLVARGAFHLGEQGRQERLPIGDPGQSIDGRAVVRVGQGGRDRVDGDARAGHRGRRRVVATSTV